MTTVANLDIQIHTKGAAQSAAQLKKLGIRVDRTGTAAEQLRAASMGVGRGLTTTAAAATATKTRLAALGATLRKLVPYLGLGDMVTAGARVLALADQYRTLENRFIGMGQSAAQASQSLDTVVQIAMRTRAPLAATAHLYSRLSIAAGDLNANGRETAQFTQAVGMALASAEGGMAGAARAVSNLSQAMGGGVVQGAQFNAIYEDAYPLVLAAAKGMDQAGGSVKRLRQLVIAGEVSSQQFFDAILDQAPQIQAAFDNTALTIGQANTQLATAFTAFVGNADQSTRITTLLAQSISGLASGVSFLADNLDTLAIIAGTFGAVALNRVATPAITSMAAQTRSMAAQARLAVAHVRSVGLVATTSAVAMRGLSAAMALAGGPVGIGLLVGGGLLAWMSSVRQHAKDAAAEFDSNTSAIQSLAPEVEGLAAAYQSLNEEQRIQLELKAAANFENLRNALGESIRGLRGGLSRELGNVDYLGGATDHTKLLRDQLNDLADTLNKTASDFRSAQTKDDFNVLKQEQIDRITAAKNELIRLQRANHISAQSALDARKKLDAYAGVINDLEASANILLGAQDKVTASVESLNEQFPFYKDEIYKIAEAMKAAGGEAGTLGGTLTNLEGVQNRLNQALANEKAARLGLVPAHTQLYDIMALRAKQLMDEGLSVSQVRGKLVSLAQAQGLTKGEALKLISLFPEYAKGLDDIAESAEEAAKSLSSLTQEQIIARRLEDIRASKDGLSENQTGYDYMVSVRKSIIEAQRRAEEEAAAEAGASAVKELRPIQKIIQELVPETDKLQDRLNIINEALTDGSIKKGSESFQRLEKEAQRLRDQLAGLKVNELNHLWDDFRTNGLQAIGDINHALNNLHTQFKITSGGKIEFGKGLSNSISDLLGNGGSLFSKIGGKIGGGIGAGLGNFGGGMSSISSVFAKQGFLTGMKASFGSIGSIFTGGGFAALGSALPAIGAVVAVAAAIKKAKATKVTGQSLSGSLGVDNTSVSNITSYQKRSGLFLRKKRWDTSVFNQGLTDQFGGMVADIHDGVAEAASIVGMEGIDLSGISVDFRIDTKGKAQDKIQAEIQKVMENYTNSIASAVLKGSNFGLEGESAFETLTRLSSALSTVNTTFEALGYGLHEVSLAGGAAASAFADLFGGLEGFQTATGAYFDRFYSDQEKFQFSWSQLSKSLLDLGIDHVPATTSAFRALVDKMKAAGNNELVAELIKLAPEMANVLDQSNALTDGLAGASKSFATLNEERFAKALEASRFAHAPAAANDDSREAGKLLERIANPSDSPDDPAGWKLVENLKNFAAIRDGGFNNPARDSEGAKETFEAVAYNASANAKTLEKIEGHLAKIEYLAQKSNAHQERAA